MATTSDSYEESSRSVIDGSPELNPAQLQMKRRTFMVATAGAVATAAGAGTVSARSSPELNAGSDLTPIPRVSTTTEIDDLEIGGDPLEFVEDDGTETTLGAYGGAIETTPTDADGNDQPHNPFTLRADYIDAEEYGAFPRGETYDDGDDADAPVSALHPTHWSTTSAEASISKQSAPSGGDGFRFETSGVASGSEAGIEFSTVDITSGVSRKELQAVLSVVSLGGTVELRVGDGSTWATAVVDSAADADADGTIATGTGDGIVFQAQVGDLDDTLGSITTIQLVAVDGDATIDIAALNVERETSWSFGEREVWETSDEENIVTEEFVEPMGEFSIADLGSLDDVFSGGTINPVAVGVEYWPTSTEYEVGDPTNPAYDSGLEILDNIEIPSSYDLSHGTLSVDLEVGMSPDQWETLEAVSGLSEPIELADRDDETFTDYSDNLSSIETGDDVGLGSVSAGDVVAVNQAVDVTTDQLDEIESSGAVAGGPFGGGGGGGFLSTPIGILTTLGSGIATYLAVTRGWITSLLTGS